MSVLFGHPTGNPNSHHTALAHFEAGQLEAFCVCWMPTPRQLELLRRIPGLAAQTARLSRRCFEPLLQAPRIEGQPGEWMRMAQRLIVGERADARVTLAANNWIMRTMHKHCHRNSVSAVHSSEDCSLWSFEEAKRLGKMCIYDLPIGYFAEWERTQARLTQSFPDWLPTTPLPSRQAAKLDQKRREMELSDLVLVPSDFVLRTVREHTDKKIKVTPYGVDTTVWQPAKSKPNRGDLNFLFAGQLSVRKGLPVLLNAWAKAELKSARLHLVGKWNLNEARRREFLPNVHYHGPVSRATLLEHYRSADVFVFPTFFEGRALVVGEALAAGLPVLTTPASGVDDLVDKTCGWLFEPGDEASLVELLRLISRARDKLAPMARAARLKAEKQTWSSYRESVREACAASL